MIQGAAVTRIVAINAATWRVTVTATPNADGSFVLPGVTVGATYRFHVIAGGRSYPIVWKKARASTLRSNLVRLGTKSSPRSAGLDGPVDLGDVTMAMSDGLTQLSTDDMHAPNAQEDYDEDGQTDNVDEDVDGDGTPNAMDTDNDGDGMPDAAQLDDQDGDGLSSHADDDIDGDGMANSADTDNDGDGMPDATDMSSSTAGNPPEDHDGDGIPNAEDTHPHGEDPHSMAVECAMGDTRVPPSMDPHWTYAEAAEWSTLGPGMPYSMCAGMAQTPIDLPAFSSVMGVPDPGALTFNNYAAIPLRVYNNGHTIQVNYASTFGDADPSVTFGARTYHLVQFHVHAPSEHTIANTHSLMELHLVHRATSNAGPILVVGVMLNMGESHPVITAMLSNNPNRDCERSPAMTTVNLGTLLPTNRSFWHYSPGSLTTPPCSMTVTEDGMPVGLNWFVMRDAVTVGMTQVSAFTTAIGVNNRPIQPLGTRTVSVHSE